jgi:hypothetical protein
VLNFTTRDQVPIGPRPSVTQLKGEAVFVDLGGGRDMIATLGFGPTASENKIEFLAFDAFPKAGKRVDVTTLAKSRDSAPLTGDLIPTLVTFADLNDPKSARVVRPNELDRVFGPGIRLRSARIEMTDDRASSGI